jgi:transcriptional regulator with XRE-family HTH domain
MTRGKTFGEFVRARRAKIGLGLRTAAIAVGIDPGNWSRFERGVKPPPQERRTLAAIAHVLELGPADAETLCDLAALAAGQIPPDTPRAIVALLPLLICRARRMSESELRTLARRLVQR